MAVKLPDFDVPTALPRWMEMAERLHTPMALFFANWFSPSLYTENRVLNAVGAAESLANLLYPNQRTELSDRPNAVAQFVEAFPSAERPLLNTRLTHLNDPSLRERLRQLAAGAGDAFGLVVADTRRWIGQVVASRNDIAHGNCLPGGGPWLRALAETVEHLVEVHLLIELGMTVSEVEQALRDTPRTRWISSLASEHLRVGPVP